MHAVVVESPAKARTIRTWLGREYRVLACYGHVVEQPAKKGSVDPDADFAMVCAETGKRALRAIAAALETADSLLLATEPDREGEAIAWEILTWLRERDPIGKRPAARRGSGSRRRSRRLRESDAIGGTPVHRVVFHEVTPDAVREAMTRPRGIDMDLVNAERARRVLDYLGGYGLSRVLWRELKGRGSPGRLQSVALRLICARESEIEAFTAQDYWTVDAALTARAGNPFTARLSRLDGVRLDRLALDSEAGAEQGPDTTGYAVRYETRASPTSPRPGLRTPPARPAPDPGTGTPPSIGTSRSLHGQPPALEHRPLNADAPGGWTSASHSATFTPPYE